MHQLGQFVKILGKWTLMSKTGLTDRANSDKVGEIKGEKISEGIFNSPILKQPEDLVRFFEDRANLKTPSEILLPLPL